jgi:hypothetical protein
MKDYGVGTYMAAQKKKFSLRQILTPVIFGPTTIDIRKRRTLRLVAVVMSLISVWAYNGRLVFIVEVIKRLEINSQRSNSN